MKYRVINNESGKEVKLHLGERFLMDADGRLAIHQGGHNWRRINKYTVEFAFRVDHENQWIWEHSVMHQ